MNNRRQFIERELKYLWYHPDFRNKKQEEILGPMPDQDKYEEKRKQISSEKISQENDTYALAFHEPLLSREQERHLFRKYNYLKYLAKKQYETGHLAKAISYLNKAKLVRDHLVLANIRLAISVLRKYYTTQREDVGAEAIAQLSVIVDRFDWNRKMYGRIVKFSTYATFGLQKRIIVALRKLYKQDKIYQAEELPDCPGKEISEQEISHASNKHLVDTLMRFVTERERNIITAFYLKGTKLEDIGNSLKVTRERTRQILKRGMRRIRDQLLARGNFKWDGSITLKEF